jgi:putative endonuclease
MNKTGKKTEHWFIYILECENGSLYTGYTADLARRYEEHLKGTGRSKYTRSFKPVRIARSWTLTCTRGSAMKIERLVKGLDRKLKDGLLKNPGLLNELILRDAGPGMSGIKIEAGRSDREV